MIDDITVTRHPITELIMFSQTQLCEINFPSDYEDDPSPHEVIGNIMGTIKSPTNFRMAF